MATILAVDDSATMRKCLEITFSGSGINLVSCETAVDALEKVKTLGKGSFGTAVLLRHRRTGHLVVSKQVWVQEMPRVELSKVERRTNQP